MSGSLSCNKALAIIKTAIYAMLVRNMKQLIPAFFFLFLLAVPSYSQSLAINEFMASNGGTLADEDGDFEDWIELYNYGDSVINLHGYYLSDDLSNPYRWRFPSVKLHAGEFLLVWASGKNRRSTSGYLHTQFRLDKDGELIILTDPMGNRIDEAAPKILERDMAYGRSPDGTGSWQFMKNPSPGTPNTDAVNERMLLHYWLFSDGLPNDLPLEQIPATYSLAAGARLQYQSCLDGYPFHSEHPFWRLASLERRNRPTALNYRPEGNRFTSFADAEMRGIQIKQPFSNMEQENTIVLDLPTTGFTEPLLRFAALSEGTAYTLRLDYALDEKELWQTEGIETTVELSSVYQLFEIDFSAIEAASHNPHFRIRMRLGGAFTGGDEGKRIMLNNISLDARPLKAHTVHATHGKNGLIHPYGFNRVYDGQAATFTIYPSVNYTIEKVTINGENLSKPLEIDAFGVGHLHLPNIQQSLQLHAHFDIDPEAVRSSPDSLFLFPNPASDQLNIMADAYIQKVQILDMKGQITLEQTTNSKNLQINLSGLKPGLYIVRVHKDTGIAYRRLLVVG